MKRSYFNIRDLLVERREELVNNYNPDSKNIEELKEIQTSIINIEEGMRDIDVVIAENSIFNIYEVGKALAKLVSIIERRNFVFEEAYYTNESFKDYNDVNNDKYAGKCFVIVADDAKKQVYRNNSNTGDFCKSKDLICLATKYYKIPTFFEVKKDYISGADYVKTVNIPKITDTEIKLYDESYTNNLYLDYFPYLYEFIEGLIDRKMTNVSHKLTNDDYDRLINEYVEIYRERKRQEVILEKQNSR